jgi:hypothetical protein
MSSFGFSYIDVTGQVLPTGVRVVQRVSRQPLRWLCRCERCGSERVFDHVRVMAAIQGATGNVAQCDLSNCRLFGTATKPVPPTVRPEHDPVPATPLVEASVPAPVPKRVPPDPLQADYNRLLTAQRHWGNNPWSFADFKTCRELKPDFFNEVMQNVANYEREMKRQAELEAFGEQFQREWEADFAARYDIRVAVNSGGKK